MLQINFCCFSTTFLNRGGFFISMSDLDIGKSIEEETTRKKKEENQEENREETEDKDYITFDPKSDKKRILLILSIIVAVFALSFGWFHWYNGLTGGQVVNVDELHQQNLKEELEESEGYTYNGFSFVFADGLWWTEIRQPDRLVKIPLHFGPREVENVTIEGALAPGFNQGENVYMAIDPYYANKYYTLALSELNNNLASGVRRRPVAACTENNEAICEDRPILNCENTEGKPVIELRQEGQPGIHLNGTCILITGEGFDLTRAADRLIWQWYRVMG